jgi:hypothetical protein
MRYAEPSPPTLRLFFAGTRWMFREPIWEFCSRTLMMIGLPRFAPRLPAP